MLSLHNNQIPQTIAMELFKVPTNFKFSFTISGNNRTVIMQAIS